MKFGPRLEADLGGAASRAAASSYAARFRLSAGLLTSTRRSAHVAHRRAIEAAHEPGLAYARAMPIPMLVGALVAMLGFALVLGTLVVNGGANKAHQFRVLGEIWRGAHGAGSRRALRLALPLMFLGTCTAFTGSVVRDARVRQACEARCRATGFATGALGPTADKSVKPRAVCRCSEGAGPEVEIDLAQLTPE